MTMNIEKIIDILCEDRDEKKVEGFIRFLSDKLWNQYNDYLMDKVLMAENEVKAIAFNIPNAKENQPYDQKVVLPEESKVIIESVTGLSVEQHGLYIKVAEDKKGFSITGTPSLEYYRKDGALVQTSSFDLIMRYQKEPTLLINLIQDGDKIVLGVSGGPDSMCMLDMMRELKEEKTDCACNSL